MIEVFTESRLKSFVLRKGRITLNQKHAIEYGLRKVGLEHPQSLIDQNRLDEILELKDQGFSNNKIAKKFGYQSQTVDTWIKKYYDKPYPKVFRGTQSPKNKYTEEQVLECVKLRKDGLTFREISERTKVSEGQAASIMRGESWSWLTGIKA